MEVEAVILRHSRIREKREYSLTELLLDDRLAAGEIVIPASASERVGGENRRLMAKRRYEWLLRLAEQYPVVGEPADTENDEPEEDAEESFRTDCYVASRYAELLRREGLFDVVLSSLIENTGSASDRTFLLEMMEELIGKGVAYRLISRATEPVLLYYGPTWCYNALNIIVDGLREGLTELGIPVQTYNAQQGDVQGLSCFFGQSFQAIVDIQSYLFPVFLKEQGRFLHDMMDGPKLDLILDHPVWLKENLERLPPNTICLTHDPHYRDFIQRFYPAVTDAFLFPPAGREIKGQKEVCGEDRPIELLFIGTYGDYRKKEAEIRACSPGVKRLALVFLRHLKKEPQLTAEAAFQRTLDELGISAEGQQFLEFLYGCRSVIQLVMFYYRERIIRTLLEGGISVEIYGETWKEAPFAGHPLCKIHGDVTYEESLMLFQKAKLSLNIMAWHKGGFTERMANSMLNGAVVLTDETDHPFLKNGENICMFSLSDLKALPDRVREILSDAEGLNHIRKEAYHFAKEKHTWSVRAAELLSILDREEEKWLQESM